MTRPAAGPNIAKSWQRYCCQLPVVAEPYIPREHTWLYDIGVARSCSKMWTAHCQNLVFIAFVFLPSVVRGISDFSGLPPGSYCASRNPINCCPERQDECSVPILGTLCYCDDFCDRTRGDCCPDYWYHCRGTPPEPIKECSDSQGKQYKAGQKFKDNCNTCICTLVNGLPEKLCEKKRCLIESNLIGEINSKGPNLGWQAGNYSEFWEKTLEDGLKFRLGTLSPSESVKKMIPVRRNYNSDTLPREFDSRWEFGKNSSNRIDISGVHDQGWCGASWAVSTADVASDRFSIMSQGTENVKLSAQHLLSCNNRGQLGCSGGYLDRAWLFMRRFGLVDKECYPWTGEQDKCKLRHKRSNLKAAGCRNPPNPLRTELYKVGPAYRLENESDIMQEIRTSGPVQATMRVYHDFFVYRSGIYRHFRSEKYDSNLKPHYHSVRIIGWGEETSYRGPPIKYWLVVNSWGDKWGENGLFKIERGTNESEIESFVLGVWAKTI